MYYQVTTLCLDIFFCIFTIFLGLAVAEDVHSPMGGSDDAVIFAVQEYFIDNGSVRQWLMEYNDCTQALCIICQNPHGRDRHIGIDS